MLPTYATPLVGRNIYLTEIARLLADPECRLLTLVGPGGIGKTRLAVEAAHRHQTCDAVYFVPLQQVASPELLPAAIASAVGLRTAGTGNPQQELLEQLRNKQWLLVLDNFDQLLEGATLLSTVLAVAPNLRLLVTSRLRLDVLEEFVLEIVGLACPFSEHDGNFERSGAVELFVQRARRVNSTFALTSAQRHAVFRIVHLVEGMPLGIELAANWVRALSCDTIADEIERNLDILESSGRNLEPRHRTMRAAFASTWQQLSPEEQDTFMRLSVFRGGFTRPAAAAVAGASLSLLSALIDKSLLRSDETDRFNVHELLRQYAQEWLERDAEAARCARDAHSAYYAGFLEARGDAITGTMQQRILSEVAAELDNIRAAWSWAVCQLHVDHLQRAAYTLYQFTDFRGAYREGIELFEQAKAALQTARTARAQGGATWGVLDAVTQVYGLAAPGGVFSDTGIAGLTLGGGYGWLRGKHGLSCDNLVAAEIVTADGRVVHADENQNPDLLWGPRGGGGSFGVVTTFSYRLHPVGPDVMLTFVMQDGTGEKMKQGLQYYREFCTTVPDEASTIAVCGQVPPEPAYPAELHMRPFILFGGLYAGDPQEGQRVLQPLRNFGAPLLDFSGVRPYLEAQRAWDADYPTGRRYYWKSANLLSLTGAMRPSLSARRQAGNIKRKIRLISTGCARASPTWRHSQMAAAI